MSQMQEIVKKYNTTLSQFKREISKLKEALVSSTEKNKRLESQKKSLLQSLASLQKENNDLKVKLQAYAPKTEKSNTRRKKS